jgi:hypothetical protein
MIESPHRRRVASLLRQHLWRAHQERIEPADALAFTTYVCECGQATTIKLKGGWGYICVGCEEKDKYRTSLERDDADYGRPMRDAALEEDKNPGHCLQVYDLPRQTRAAA